MRPAKAAAMLFTLTLSACVSLQGPPTKLTEAQRTEYVTMLEAMMEADQRHRGALTWKTTDPEEIARFNAMPAEEALKEMSRRSQAGLSLPAEERARLTELQTELDRENTRMLKDLIERYGWPREEVLGPHPNPTAILIHMQMDDAEILLPILKAEVQAKRMDPKTYATIYDRKLQHDGEPQLYGRCQAFDRATQQVLPPAIVDIEATNRARSAIGLPPLEAYRLTDAATAAGR